MADSGKSEGAFRTIGEVSQDLGVPQHILRYWETRFAQLKPMQRAGNRRYYRPADVELARKIHHLLNDKGYTVQGVQQLLKSGGASLGEASAPAAEPLPQPETSQESQIDRARLVAIREKLAAILES